MKLKDLIMEIMALIRDSNDYQIIALELSSNETIHFYVESSLLKNADYLMMYRNMNVEITGVSTQEDEYCATNTISVKEV